MARKGRGMRVAFLCPIIDDVKVALDLMVVEVTCGFYASPLEVDLREVAGCCDVELIDTKGEECETCWV